MKNIYDLEGNYFEWTAEANYTVDRVRRGGGYDIVSGGTFNPASYRSTSSPASTSHYSARAGLYVNLQAGSDTL